MWQTNLKTAYILSIIIAILAAVASVGGLFLNGLYRDNLFVTSAWKGNDVVTLLIAIPLLVTALAFSARGSLRAQLIWMGVLDYMLYNYAFYLFGAAFNWFFLIYVALLGLSIFALVFGLVNLDVNRIRQQFRERTPVRWIAGYMLFVAAGLSLVYFAQSLAFIFTGQLPAIVTRTGHPTSVVFALDLTLLVPVLVLGAVWLLRRKPWGYVLAGVSTVKGAAYALVLAASSFWAANAGVPDAAAEIPLWLFLTVIGMLAGMFLFGSLNQAKQTPHP
jgi:hypothetical protein